MNICLNGPIVGLGYLKVYPTVLPKTKRPTSDNRRRVGEAVHLPYVSKNS